MFIALLVQISITFAELITAMIHACKRTKITYLDTVVKTPTEGTPSNPISDHRDYRTDSTLESKSLID